MVGVMPILLLAVLAASCVSPDTISAAVEQAQAAAEQAAQTDPSGSGSSLLTNPLTILEIALIALLTRFLGPMARPIVSIIMGLIVGIMGKKTGDTAPKQ